MPQIKNGFLILPKNCYLAEIGIRGDSKKKFSIVCNCSLLVYLPSCIGQETDSGVINGRPPGSSDVGPFEEMGPPSVSAAS